MTQIYLIKINFKDLLFGKFLFYLKCFLGVLFLFNVILGGALGWQMLISGILSLVAAILVARDSSRVRELYRKKAEYSVAPVL